MELPKPEKLTLSAVALPPPPTRHARPARKQADVKKTIPKPKPPPPIDFIPMYAAVAKSPPPQEIMLPPRADKQVHTSDIHNGRVLLRLLETGKGPSIEISWPASETERARLYRLFTHCFGMETALLDGHDKLYRINGTPGQAWRPNLDRFSSFMRKPTGGLSKEEVREIQNIRKHHAVTGGTPVRLFPRNIDAVLLATLKDHLEEEYETNQDITASYFLNGNDVTVSQIRINGRNTTASINLISPLKCTL